MGKSFTGCSLFSGGGIGEIGLSDCVEMVGAVEFDKSIAAHYASVWGDYITCADVADVDYRQFAGIDWGHASPSCRNASGANSKGGETPGDIAAGLAVERFIEQARPRVFTLENVRGYAAFGAFAGICRKLTECGYTWDTQTVNAADFGVAQTRIRLFIRAWLSPKPLPRLEPTHAERGKIARSAAVRGLFDDAPLLPWVGWYEAIEDLIPTLPESQFAPWQLKRLVSNPMGEDLLTRPCKFGPQERGRGYFTRQQPSSVVMASANGACAFLVSDQTQGTGKGEASIRDASEPSVTVRANVGGGTPPRAFLVDGQQTVPGKNGERLASTRNADEPCLAVCASQAKGMPRAFLVDGQQTQGTGKTRIGTRNADEPCITVCASQAKGMPRAFLMGVQGEGGDLQRPSDSPAQTVTSNHSAAKSRAFLVEGDAAGDRCPTIRQGEEPSFCLKTGSGGRVHRAVIEGDEWLNRGRVISMTTRCSARFMGIPDSYPLPENKKLASTIIGNGVCPPVLRALVLPLLTMENTPA